MKKVFFISYVLIIASAAGEIPYSSPSKKLSFRIINHTVCQQKSGSGDCGLHASYNGATLLQCAQGILTRSECGQNLQHGSSAIESLRKICRSKTALQTEDVFNALIHYGISANNFSIIPNLPQIVPNVTGKYLPIGGSHDFIAPTMGAQLTKSSYVRGFIKKLYDDVGLDALQVLADGIKKVRSQSGAAHLFIIGNSTIGYDARSQHYVAQERLNDHWIAIVARNDHGTIVLEVADSLGRHADLEQALQEMISHIDYNATTLAQAPSLILKAKKDFQDLSYGKACKALKMVFQAAQQAQVLNTPNWAFFRQELASLLKQVQNSAHEPYKTEAASLTAQLD